MSVDVAIVGGGPAGCAAAIACVDRDLSAVIVDPAAGKGDRPGETLHPGAEVMFETLGVREAIDEAGFVRHEGHWVEGDFQRFGEDWRGYQAPASKLDAILLERAIAGGAEVRREIACGVRRSVLITASGEINARVIIDASGRRQWLASAMGLPRVIRSAPLVALYGYLRGDDDAPMFQTLGDGWTWTAPIGGGRVAWVRLARAADVERALAEAPPLDAHARAADVTWRVVDPLAGPGYFLAGDAAFVLDPASSHGVLKALLSGRLAGRCAADLLTGVADEDAIAREYNRVLRTMFDHDVEKLRELYAQLGLTALVE